MNMGPRLVQSFAAVTYARDSLGAIDSLTNIYRDFAEVTVKAVARRSIPIVFDDNVTPVV